MDAIRTLIVDDEYLIRSLVRNSIDWEGLGFFIVGEAEDGEEALRLADELRPRLMIVDINIPFINGLDLSMRLREAHPDIRIVILTGYEDFQFARTAIKVGVVDYLLKPINPDELRKAVLAAREGILRDDEERRAATSAAARSKEDALRALLAGGYSDATESERRAFDLVVDPERGPVVLCLFDVDPPVFAEVARGFAAFPCELFPYRGGRLVMLAAEDDRTIRVKDKAYYAACEAILAGLKARGCAVSVGIAPPVTGADGLPLAYERASTVLEEAFYVGADRIHVYPGGRRQDSDRRQLPALPPRESIMMRLRGGGGGEVALLVKALFRDLGRARAGRQYCEMLCLEIVLVVNEFLKDAGLPVVDDPYRDVRERTSLEALAAWLTGLIRRSAEAVETQGRTRTHQVAKKAKLFIERNFARKTVTLEQIAENSAVTASYISSIFKKEIGVSVIEYLTNIRLEAAKKLMDEDPLVAIGDVADRVGYSDPYYFSKCFRKRFGIAPTMYLRRKGLSTPE